MAPPPPPPACNFCKQTMNFRQLSSLTETIIRPRPCLLPSTRCWILNGKQQPRLPGSYVPFTRFIQRTENFARGNANASEAGQGHTGRLSAQARHSFVADVITRSLTRWPWKDIILTPGGTVRAVIGAKDETFSAPFFSSVRIEFACSSTREPQN